VLKRDPFGLQRLCWPWIRWGRKQRDMVEAVRDARQTFVRSANMMGKDFCAAYIAIAFFVCPEAFFDDRHNLEAWRFKSPEEKRPRRRIVTTSNTDDHLNVLWGEIGSMLASAREPLLASKGGGLVMHSKEVRFADEWGAQAGNVPNYLVGMVSNVEDKFSGHHAPWTLVMGDEASALSDGVQRMTANWAKRELWWGNPWPCTNFWRRGIEAGDLRVEDVGKRGVA